MRLVSYGAPLARIGLLLNDNVIDLRAAYGLYLQEVEQIGNAEQVARTCIPETMNDFMRLYNGSMRRFVPLQQYAEAQGGRLLALGIARPVAQVTLLAANPNPGKIICCGNSYARYLTEWGLPKEEWPQDVKISFLKSPASLLGHEGEIQFPPDSEQWDYENELAVVIGAHCSDIEESEASKYIFGYTILNDACVRDIPAWTGRYDSPRGKACDTLAPLGPCITPAEFLPKSPNELHIRTTVDGELRQDDTTAGLLWPIERIVAFVSRYMTLSPGDILSTGSTSGNALVCGKWLREGQTIECEIEGIGVLRNRVGRRHWHATL
ncbi:fumarylacetoacetate hydrolase family protein [Alcaligenaceae bacterium CGII-47]|nr:fumarylacetoacetate hydrolase family protein [Alcaligenaceae bacterium CGII-47]